MTRPALQVPEDQLREWFNDSDILARLAANRLRPKVKHDRPGPDFLPIGSVSQIVQYLDPDDVVVAEVHQYVLPNGSIGASGMPDPKGMLRDGTWYFVV